MGTIGDYQRWAIGYDAAVTNEEAQRALRSLFLAVLHEDAVDVIRDLAALPDDSDVALWAERHHIGQPWVREAAVAARQFWREFAHSGSIPSCWPVEGEDNGGWTADVWLPAEKRGRLSPTDPRRSLTPEQAIDGLTYDVPRPRSSESDASFGTRLRRHEASRRKELLQHDPRRSRRRRVDPLHLRWVVRHVVLSHSYTEIAGTTEAGVDCGKAVRRLRRQLPL